MDIFGNDTIRFLKLIYKNMRINFYTIFNVDADGGISSKEKTIRIGGVQFGPGERFKNVSFGGVNSSALIGRDLEVRNDAEIYTIIGIY